MGISRTRFHPPKTSIPYPSLFRSAARDQISQSKCPYAKTISKIGEDFEIALIKLSVGLTCQAYLLEIDGLLTQGSRPGRTVGESVSGIF